MGKRKLKNQLKRSIDEKWRVGKGMPRADIKNAHNWTPYIHSETTYNSYMKHCMSFAEWCSKKGYMHVQEDIKEVVYVYIEEGLEKGWSASTASSYLNAIAKGLDLKSTDIPIDLPERRRQDIKRSRLEAERDKHFNPENHKELVTFQKAFGLRKNQELARLVRANFIDDGKNLYIKLEKDIGLGTRGKGGKGRTVKAYCSEEEKQVIREFMKTVPEGRKIFTELPSAYDCHADRAEYASRVYHAEARDIKTVPPKDKYVCRKDKKGDVYDKEALKVCSEMLGHSRCDVVVNNYAWKF